MDDEDMTKKNTALILWLYLPIIVHPYRIDNNIVILNGMLIKSDG